MQEAPPRHVPGEPPSPDSVRLWPPTARGVHLARHDLAEALAAWEEADADLADAAALVLSELMTNAMQHAKRRGRKIGTRFLRSEGGALRIEVHDSRDELPQRREAGLWDERGRGLALVDTLTGGRWGTDMRVGPGKVVWAEVGAGHRRRGEPGPLLDGGGQAEPPAG